MIWSNFSNRGIFPESTSGIRGIFQINIIKIIYIKNRLIDPPAHTIGRKAAEIPPVFRVILENIIFRLKNRRSADGYPRCPALSKQGIGCGRRPAKNGITINRTISVQFLRIGIPALGNLIPLRCNTLIQKPVPVMIHYKKLFSITGPCSDDTGTHRRNRFAVFELPFPSNHELPFRL